MKNFRSFGLFANHLTRLAVQHDAVIHHAADQVGAYVEQVAQNKIGHYQASAGPFASWADLAPSTEAEKRRLGYPENAPLERTRELQLSIRHSVLRHRVVVGSTDEVMVYHEFGTRFMPPRPVLGPAMYESKRAIVLGVGGIMAAWVAGVSWRRERIKFRKGGVR